MPSNEEINKLSREAMEGDIKKIVSFLKDNLGARITTVMSGKRDARVLNLWISGQEKPTSIEELRLRYGYEVTALVVAEYDAETARAWFICTHELLNDGSPVCWIADHEKEEDLKLVVADARYFLYR